jgi:hypothetical protein
MNYTGLIAASFADRKQVVVQHNVGVDYWSRPNTARTILEPIDICAPDDRGAAVEANALVVRPEAGLSLCREAILKYVDAGAPTGYEERLAPEREKVRIAIREMLGGIR